MHSQFHPCFLSIWRPVSRQTRIVRGLLTFLLSVPLMLLTLAPVPSRAGGDVVLDFITSADSLAQTTDEEALRTFVHNEEALVGAVVGRLLDLAFDAQQQGLFEGAAENVEFASLLAELHAGFTGAQGPRLSVVRYREWSLEQREQKKRALDLEIQSRTSRQEQDYTRALHLLDQAAVIYEAIGDRRALAVLWGSRGVIHFYRADYDEMRAAYLRALELRKAVDDRILEGRTLNGLGTVALMQEDFAGAEQWYSKAIEMRRATGDLQGLVTSLTYLGNAYFQDGKLLLAREYYAQARLLVEKLGEGASPRVADLLSSEANVLDAMGKLHEAIEVYRKSIQLYRTLENPRSELSNRLNLSDALGKVGRPREALEELQYCEDLLELNGAPADWIIFHRNRGQLRLDLGDLEGARDDVLAARELASEAGLVHDQAAILIDLGFLYHKLFAFDRARRCADEAWGLAQAERDSSLLRDAAALAGTTAMRVGDGATALRHWEIALSIDRSRQAETWLVRDELGRANALAILGKNKEARAAYHEILEELQSSGQLALAEIALLGLGHTWEKEDPQRAHEYYGQALEKVEERRASASSRIGTGFFAHETGWVFEQIVRYYASLDRRHPTAGWAGEAFAMAERGKARGLLDEMGGRGKDGPSPPHFYAAKDLQHALPVGTVVLQYALGDSSSYVFAVDREDLQLVEIAPRRRLRAEVTRLRSAVDRPGAGDAECFKIARELYRQLVEPVAAEVADADRIVIVPDGVLFDLPFELLVSEDSPAAESTGDDTPQTTPPREDDLPKEVSNPLAAAHYFAQDVVSSYAPSSAVYLRLLAEAPYPHRRQLVAVGDPDFSSLKGGDFASLPHTRDEVEAIGALYPTGEERGLLGKEATESAVKRALAEDRPLILHLATHGLADPVEPERSCVVLGAGEGEDGYLRAEEIAGLSFAPTLVVLSACETAAGRVQRGEGVVGLARSFLAGGSRAVVASLWPVSDASTARLMRGFYAELQQGHDAALALAAARRALLATPEDSHPFNWAAFVLIGNPQTP